jgi:hypothetical protein
MIGEVLYQSHQKTHGEGRGSKIGQTVLGQRKKGIEKQS